MKKRLNLPAVYAYLVCFIMLIMFIVAAGKTVHAFLEMVVPNPQAVPYEGKMLPEDAQNEIIITPEAREVYKEYSLAFQRREKMAEIIGGLIMLAIIIPMYIYHWRLGNSHRNSEGTSTGIREIYFYLASLITLIIALLGLTQLIDNFVIYSLGGRYYLPPLDVIYRDLHNLTANITITADDAKELIEKYVERQNNFNRYSFISNATMFIIAFPLYLMHWLTVKKAEKL